MNIPIILFRVNKKTPTSYLKNSSLESNNPSFYINLARQLVSDWGHIYGSEVQRLILSSEENLSQIVDYLIKAELSLDTSIASLHTYRVNAVKYAIKNYINRIHKNKLKIKTKVYSINKYDDESLVPTECSLKQVEDREYIDNLFQKAEISERDKDIFTKVHSGGMTYIEIGEQHGISKQRVDQIIQNTRVKLRRAAGVVGGGLRERV